MSRHHPSVVVTFDSDILIFPVNRLGRIRMLLHSKENWMMLTASAIYMFHRYLGLATMFGINTVWILPFNIKNRANVSLLAFCAAVIPFGFLERKLSFIM